MYQNPVLFPAISNRESWEQIIQLADDDTGDLISLTDNLGNPLYGFTVELAPAGPHSHGGGYYPSSVYDTCSDVTIDATLADYIFIIDTGTIQIAIPRSKMKTLRAQSYDVFLTITTNGVDDGRQLLIGRLPVLYGGRNT